MRFEDETISSVTDYFMKVFFFFVICNNRLIVAI